MFKDFLKRNGLVNFLTDFFKKEKNEKESNNPMKNTTKIFIKIRTITDDEIIGNLKNFNNNLIDLSDAYFVTNPKLIFPTLVIRMEDSLKISEIQENEGFVTDSEFMSKKEAKKVGLVHFECKNSESENLNLKESKSWDQFKANEQLFGIKSSFDESQYTVVLDKNSEFYKKNVEHAKRLAQEILSKKCTDRHRMEERGHFYDINEEEKYSSVLNDRKKRNSLIKKKETFKKENTKNLDSKSSDSSIHRPSSPVKEAFKKENTRNVELKSSDSSIHRPSSPVKEAFKKESTKNFDSKSSDSSIHRPSSPIKETFKKENIKILESNEHLIQKPSSPIKELVNLQINSDSKSSDKSISSLSKEKEKSEKNTEEMTQKQKTEENKAEVVVSTKKISYGKPISRTFKNFKTFIEAVTSKFTYSFKTPTSWGCGEHYTEYKENKSESAIRPSIIGYGYSNYRKK